MRFLSWDKRNVLVPKLFDFADFFFFHLPLTLPCSNREKKAFVKLFGDGMAEKESITDVQCRQEKSRQASLPTGKVDPRVGVFLSPLNTNDGFYLFLFH